MGGCVGCLLGLCGLGRLGGVSRPDVSAGFTASMSHPTIARPTIIAKIVPILKENARSHPRDHDVYGASERKCRPADIFRSRLPTHDCKLASFVIKSSPNQCSGVRRGDGGLTPPSDWSPHGLAAGPMQPGIGAWLLGGRYHGSEGQVGSD